MQKSLQFLLLIAFLFITMKTQAAVSPEPRALAKSVDQIWPSIESFVRHDPRFTEREMAALNTHQLQKYFDIITEIFPATSIQTSLVTGEDQLPESLIAAGFHLRELRKISEMRGDLTNLIFDFLVQCSVKKEINSTMATVCLGHALHLSSKVKTKLPLELYPARMVELAQLTL